MKGKKLLLLPLAVILSLLICHAESYRLKITDATDHIHYFDLDNSLTLEVEGATLKVSASDGQAEILLSDLKYYAYEKGSSALETATSGNFSISPEGISYTAADDAVHTYAVHNMAGMKVDGGEFRNELHIVFAQLTPGTYIFSTDAVSPIKFVVR